MIVALGALLDSIVDLLIFPKIVMKNIANVHRMFFVRLTDWEHGPPLKITDHDFKNFFKFW